MMSEILSAIQLLVEVLGLSTVAGCGLALGAVIVNGRRPKNTLTLMVERRGIR